MEQIWNNGFKRFICSPVAITIAITVTIFALNILIFVIGRGFCWCRDVASREELADLREEADWIRQALINGYVVSPDGKTIVIEVKK